MMSSNKGLLESIEQTAEKERENIVKDAQEKAAKIMANAELESKKILDDFEHERDILLITEASRIKNKARKEVQEKIFNLKNDIVSECLSSVLKEIDNIKKDKKRYKKILKDLIDESNVGFDENKKLVLRINKNDDQLIDEILKSLQGRKLKVEPSEDFIGGVVICDSDGKKVVYNTFESRLERFKRAGTSILTKELF
jgi:vacuolar-type H+-ATPase subunit E/Vma4